MVNSFHPLTIFAKTFYRDVWLGSKYTSSKFDIETLTPKKTTSKKSLSEK